MAIRATVVVSVCVFACVACSLTDFSGFSGGAQPDVEAGADAALDSPTSDSSSTPDALADASTDSPEASVVFFDDFNRPDSPTIGNGWIPKQPAFTIKSNRLDRLVANGLTYVDNILYRPPAENLLDVRISEELTFAAPVGQHAEYVQLHLRVQTDTVTTGGQLDSYEMFPPSGGISSMIIVRQHGGVTGPGPGVILTTVGLSAPFDTTHTFRLSLSAQGTNPVILVGTIEVLNGTSWQVIGQGSVSDFDAERIDRPGSVGITATSAGEQTGDYSYDNFRVERL
jgi:hypothetical protein